MSLFNIANDEWETGEGSLILGQAPGLYDSVHLRHPELFRLYKLQKSMDWAEDEISLEQSRQDLLTCPKSVRDMMLINIAYQWETDTVAARTVAPLFAPFITNSEFWSAMLKNCEIEVLHALTYSEIVRQCVPDPNEVFELVLKNEHVTERLSPIIYYFEALQKAGAEYTLGIRKNDQSTFNIVMLALIALYMMERFQFMSSFATTFGIVEQGYFIAIGKYIQKIMLDELLCHSETVRYAILVLLRSVRGQVFMAECRQEVLEMLNVIKRVDYAWNAYQFSEGRVIVGVNEVLMNSWSDYNAQFIYRDLGFDVPVLPSPLKYMDNWIDIDKIQNAQQEESGNNYALNSVVDDLADDEILEF